MSNKLVVTFPYNRLTSDYSTLHRPFNCKTLNFREHLTRKELKLNRRCNVGQLSKYTYEKHFTPTPVINKPLMTKEQWLSLNNKKSKTCTK